MRMHAWDAACYIGHYRTLLDSALQCIDAASSRLALCRQAGFAIGAKVSSMDLKAGSTGLAVTQLPDGSLPPL